MKLSLNVESANALRELAESMPLAIQNLVDSTLKVVTIYQSVSETLGEHRQAFYELLLLIKKAQEQTTETIEVLPIMLNATADKVDAYVAMTINHPSQPPPSVGSLGGTTGMVSNNTTKDSADTKKQTSHKPLVTSYTDAVIAVMNDVHYGSGKVITEEQAKKMLHSVQNFSGEYSRFIRAAYKNPKASQEDIEELRALDSYISNAPKWEGKIFRGINVSKKVAEDIFSKDTVDMLGPASWSSELDVAERFAQRGGEPVSIIFVLEENQSGASITHIGSYNGVESEVLAPSGVQYTIDHRENIRIDNRNYTYVYVHEYNIGGNDE